MEHAGTEDVASIVGSHFEPVDCGSFEQADAFDFTSCSLDFWDSEGVKLLFLFGFAHDFAVVFEHDGKQGLGGG